MADSSISVGGVPVDTRTNAGGDHRQVLVVGNEGDVVAGVEPFGAVSVNMGPQTLFYDSWSTSPVDTAEKWTVTGNTPTIAGGNMTMSVTVSSFNAIRTKDTIRPNAGFTYVANGITLETGTVTGAGRFWGLGTPASSPAPGVLVQDGVGFELDQTTGALLAVTYTGGARATVATLPKPVDGITHRYALYFRVTNAMWFIDNLHTPVASVAFPNLAVVELPSLIVRQNAAAFGGGTPVFTNIATLAGDTSRQGAAICDPVIGTRMARVTAGGALAVAVRGSETTGTGVGNIFVARNAAVGTSASVIQAAPAAGLSIYITDIHVSNSGSALSVVSLLPTAGTAVIDVVAAATGGGRSVSLQTPIKIAANTGLSVIASVASTALFCTVTGYIAP